MKKNVIQINGGITMDVNVSVKNIIYVKKIIFEIPLHVVAKNLATIIDDSVITCDEIVEKETKTITTNFNEKNAICKTKNFYILLVFLLIIVELLIAVSIYRYLIQYKAKQKHLLLLYVRNNEK